jgi:hypothetical protein
MVFAVTLLFRLQLLALLRLAALQVFTQGFGAFFGALLLLDGVCHGLRYIQNSRFKPVFSALRGQDRGG